MTVVDRLQSAERLEDNLSYVAGRGSVEEDKQQLDTHKISLSDRLRSPAPTPSTRVDGEVKKLHVHTCTGGPWPHTT